MTWTWFREIRPHLPRTQSHMHTYAGKGSFFPVNRRVSVEDEPLSAHTQRNTSLEQSVAKTNRAQNSLLLYFTANLEEQFWLVSSNVLFMKKKRWHQVCVCVCVCIFFPLQSWFSSESPRRPGTIPRGSCFLFSALVVNVFNDNSVGSTTRHSQHTDDKGSREKEGLHYYCASDKEKPQRKKAKETRMVESICCL